MEPSKTGLDIIVWCLPERTEEEIRSLHNDIVKTAMEIARKDINIEDKDDVFVFFPPDRMRYGLGDTIRIKIDCDGCSHPILALLAENIGNLIWKFSPNSRIRSKAESVISSTGLVFRSVWCSPKPSIPT